MDDQERDRRSDRVRAELHGLLNEEQRAALLVLERFGWYLKFVRCDETGHTLAAVYDPDQHRYAVLDDDGYVKPAPEARFRAH